MVIYTNLIRILRLLKKTAAVYLLLLFLHRPLRVTDPTRLLSCLALLIPWLPGFLIPSPYSFLFVFSGNEYP